MQPAVVSKFEGALSRLDSKTKAMEERMHVYDEALSDSKVDARLAVFEEQLTELNADISALRKKIRRDKRRREAAGKGETLKTARCLIAELIGAQEPR